MPLDFPAYRKGRVSVHIGNATPDRSRVHRWPEKTAYVLAVILMIALAWGAFL
jgi:hypothetical protein